MRWTELFADLEAQAAAWERAEIDAEIADRTRAEQGTVAWAQRLSAAIGSTVDLEVQGAAGVGGQVTAMGADWLLLEQEPHGGELLVLLAGILGVHDLGRRAHAEGARGQVLARLGVASPLRAIARDRSTVLCCLRDGSQRTGTPERVGVDHLDLVLRGTPVESGPGLGRLTVPFSALSTLGRAPSGWC